MPRSPLPAGLRVSEVFGLSPLGARAAEALKALRGDPNVPPTRFDASSLKMFRPALALPLWLGRPARGREVPIYNLYNYLQPPPEEGWSVRVTRVRDFLGTGLTYDSHNGTDFAVPLGTVVVAAAAGVVRRISREFDRGGLKVFVDHGDGLITTSNHLARPLVAVGDRVARGQPIALSGYSGIDGLSTFPWGAPHVHYNVWHNGRYVDPFAPPGEASLWRTGNWPTPLPAGAPDDAFAESEWDEDAVEASRAACRDEAARAEMDAAPDLATRAVTVMFHRLYYPTRFAVAPPLYRSESPRGPRLDLPFRAEDFDGIVFLHGAAPAR